MPYVLEDLVINRVDLVDEGANSAAFIELYKRKEQNVMGVTEIVSKMKPEHAEVIMEAINKAAEELKEAQENLAKAESERDEAKKECDDTKKELETANEDLETAKSELETLKADSNSGGAAFDETETLKSMPEDVRAVFEKMKAQKEAAEAEILKAKEEQRDAEAIAKAAELKSLPIEKEKLVGIIKNADTDLLDVLQTLNAAIESTVLGEVGKNHTDNSAGSDAWSRIEAKAAEVAKRDNITKQKAVAVVIKEDPKLYEEYLNGGAN